MMKADPLTTRNLFIHPFGFAQDRLWWANARVVSYVDVDVDVGKITILPGQINQFVLQFSFFVVRLAHGKLS